MTKGNVKANVVRYGVHEEKNAQRRTKEKFTPSLHHGDNAGPLMEVPNSSKLNLANRMRYAKKE